MIVLNQAPINLARVKDALAAIKEKQPKVIADRKPIKIVRVGIDYDVKRGLIGQNRVLTSFMVFSTEQMEILKSQNPTFRLANASRLLGHIWRNMSGHQKLVYDAVAEKIRDDPFTGVNHKTFSGM